MSTWDRARTAGLLSVAPMCYGALDEFLPKYVEPVVQGQPQAVMAGVNAGIGMGYSPYIVHVRGNFSVQLNKLSENSMPATALISGAVYPTRYNGGIVYDTRSSYAPWTSGLGMTPFLNTGSGVLSTKLCYGMGSYTHYSWSTMPDAVTASHGWAKACEGNSPCLEYHNPTTQPIGTVGAIDLTTRVAD